MKIPDNAKKVFEGVIFDVYQWEQKMFDGSKETFERLIRPDTVAIIATEQNKLLLVEELQPGWSDPWNSLIGGRVDAGEDPLTAAKRELLEETGYVSDDWEEYFVEEPVSKMQWRIITYIARNCTKQQEPKLDAGEKIELKKVSYEEFIEIAIHEEFRSKELTGKIMRMKFENRLEDLKKKLNLV